MCKRVLIACIDSEGGIGKDGFLPWHNSTDLKMFKQLTTGHTVVFGMNTYKGMKAKGVAPLPDRQNVIVTSNPDLYNEQEGSDNLWFTDDPNVVNDRYGKKIETNIYYCGGANLYKQALANDYVDAIYLSRLYKSYGCDTFFPNGEDGLIPTLQNSVFVYNTKGFPDDGNNYIPQVSMPIFLYGNTNFSLRLKIPPKFKLIDRHIKSNSNTPFTFEVYQRDS